MAPVPRVETPFSTAPVPSAGRTVDGSSYDLLCALRHCPALAPLCLCSFLLEEGPPTVGPEPFRPLEASLLCGSHTDLSPLPGEVGMYCAKLDYIPGTM